MSRAKQRVPTTVRSLAKEDRSEPLEQLYGPDSQCISDYFQSPKGHTLASRLEPIKMGSV